MRPNTLTTAATYSLLALAGGVSLLLPESITVRSAQADSVEPMTTMQLVGVVRDFKEHAVEGGRADFEPTTPGGNSCGNGLTSPPTFAQPALQRE